MYWPHYVFITFYYNSFYWDCFAITGFIFDLTGDYETVFMIMGGISVAMSGILALSPKGKQ